MLTQIVNVYHHIPSDLWLVLGSALALSGATEAIKRLLVQDLSNLGDGTKVALTTGVAFAGAGLDYITQVAQTNPLVIGSHTAILLGAMHLAYTFVIKPFGALLADAKAYRAAQLKTVVPTAADQTVAEPVAAG